MRIGIFSTAATAGTIDEVVADAQRAEEQGFASYWVSQVFSYDALTLLAVVGRETGAIELGTSVVPTYPRHPAVLAAQALTTQAACDGRLTLGIGLSHQPIIEGMYGLSFDKPVRHLREYLEVLMPLVDQQPASFQGETLAGQIAVDVPGASPVPVLVAALGPQLLRLAGRRTAGTVTWMTGPATIGAHTAPQIRAAADAAGYPEPRVVCGLQVSVTDDVDAARERAAKAYQVYGQLPSYRAMLDREGAAGPEDVAIIGREDAVAARIRALADAGVTDFAASEFGPSRADRQRTRELLHSLVGG